MDHAENAARSVRFLTVSRVTQSPWTHAVKATTNDTEVSPNSA
jgi:hypothetical protein